MFKLKISKINVSPPLNMYCVDKNQNFRNSTQVRQQDKPAVRGGGTPGEGGYCPVTYIF